MSVRAVWVGAACAAMACCLSVAVHMASMSITGNYSVTFGTWADDLVQRHLICSLPS
jgi:hypothetical protein